jgi:hypothetical protein
MGRPRKRRNVDSPKEKAMDSPSQAPADVDLSTFNDHLQPFPLDADYSSYYGGDSYSANAGFLDYGAQSYNAASTSQTSMPIDPTLSGAATYQSGYDTQFQFGAYDVLGGMGGYDEEPHPREMEMTREYVHRVFGSFPDDPDSSSPSSSQTRNPNQSQKSLHSAKCECLSSLYLGLDALANLPSDPFPAIRVARNGSKIAYNVVKCPSCSIPLVQDPLAVPPMDAFQNMMLLGALIPSICNAYMRILELIDNVVAEAQREDRKLHFSFAELGGLWGKLVQVERTCLVASSVNDKDLDAPVWRKTVLATLRADIYGFTFNPGQQDSFNDQVPPFKHPGLKQVVQLLEERSRIRHEKLDTLAQQGQHCQGVFGPPGHDGTDSKGHQCMRLIEVAKIALDRLVIP